MTTYKSESKQRTLTTFRINTYTNMRGAGNECQPALVACALCLARLPPALSDLLDASRSRPSIPLLPLPALTSTSFPPRFSVVTHFDSKSSQPDNASPPVFPHIFIQRLTCCTISPV